MEPTLHLADGERGSNRQRPRRRPWWRYVAIAVAVLLAVAGIAVLTIVFLLDQLGRGYKVSGVMDIAKEVMLEEYGYELHGNGKSTDARRHQAQQLPDCVETVRGPERPTPTLTVHRPVPFVCEEFRLSASADGGAAACDPVISQVNSGLLHFHAQFAVLGDQQTAAKAVHAVRRTATMNEIQFTERYMIEFSPRVAAGINAADETILSCGGFSLIDLKVPY